MTVRSSESYGDYDAPRRIDASPAYSVLMSVYFKEQPENLQDSMQSMFNQTFPTNDFVLVCDGPLTIELDEVIETFEKRYESLHVVRLKENRGLGSALNYGLRQCANEIVARMDSDDLSLPTRMAKQIGVLTRENIDVVGSFIAEFYDDPEDIRNVRDVPENQDSIREFARLRNPMNHVSIVFRKTCVLSSGGYLDMPFVEDYYLWVRMLLEECKFYNLQEVLILVRTGDDMYRRRSGMTVCISQARLLYFMLNKGFINPAGFIKGLCVRVGGGLIPTSLRRRVYERHLRKRI